MNITQLSDKGRILFIYSWFEIPEIVVFFFVSRRDFFIHVTNLGEFNLVCRFCLNIMPFIGFVANILKISELTFNFLFVSINKKLKSNQKKILNQEIAGIKFKDIKLLKIQSFKNFLNDKKNYLG